MEGPTTTAPNIGSTFFAAFLKNSRLVCSSSFFFFCSSISMSFLFNCKPINDCTIYKCTKNDVVECICGSGFSPSRCKCTHYFPMRKKNDEKIESKGLKSVEWPEVKAKQNVHSHFWNLFSKVCISVHCPALNSSSAFCAAISISVSPITGP